ncbi:DUF4358 domain-containing protein [Paenibacillus sp. BC26]|uniref:DUF4358 domain-containing protein n=1 Tax=Paenibacillus sp. BC26 TaxID=1881032 RepID=UPI0008F3B9C5|nr:DUF4358 domain-containing protein [Paenibacillus sp. BC26]SFT14202.1 protein of unknown function [Paenibacillus sp. BC26]
MKKMMILLMTVVIAVVLGACGNGKGQNEGQNEGQNQNQNQDQNQAVEPTLSAKEMITQMTKQAGQPMFMELDKLTLKRFYGIDAAVLEDFNVRMPMANLSSNEVAIFKVKDAKDIPAVEAGIKKRAEEVQKEFQSKKADQYENAKNYKLLTKGNYVLFVISSKQAEMTKVYESFFEKNGGA